MLCCPAGAMGYLMLAGKPIGNDKVIRTGATHCGEQREFGHVSRYRFCISPLAKCACHAATTRFAGTNIEAIDHGQNVHKRFECIKCFLMTMTVDMNPFVKPA